ncbi:MAG TPA: DNA primase [Anaerolineae bacterium]|nr:DNA primase [Anaerolineae bacterium]
MTVTDDIKARIDIADLISETVKLRRSGKNYLGFCPFHPNTRTPAFVVFPDTNTWRCFGECNEGGDIFKFVMKKEGWDFPETLKYLAKRAGVKLEPLTPQKKEENKLIVKLQRSLEESVTFYRHQLLQTDAGKKALTYLQSKRGLTKQTIENFELGYAPHSWDAALNHLKGKGYSDNNLLQAGLITERQGDSGYYDRFRHRIVFPIRDTSGNMSGLGARILDPNDVPKFINSPQTILFDKSALLYGLDKARKAIRKRNQVVIVEGYLDVIALHQADYKNSVSPMGTALTEAQLRQLKRFTRKIVLALDPDAAGEKATLRGLEVAREALDRSPDIVFDVRGLIRHEARLRADLRVSTLPEGKDPDEIVLSNPDKWGQIISDAKPIITHVMDTLASGRNLNDPKIKSEIAQKITPLIEDVPNAVERDAYRQQLARMLKVDERALLAISGKRYLPKKRKSTKLANSEETQSQITMPVSEHNKAQALENHCLNLLGNHPEMLFQLDRVLLKYGLWRFSTHDFESGDHQHIASIIEESLQQDQYEPNQFIRQNIEKSFSDLAESLFTPLKAEDKQVFDDLVRSLLSLRQLRIKENINQIRFLQQDIQAQTDNPDLSSFQQELLKFIKIRALLDKALSQPIQID